MSKFKIEDKVRIKENLVADIWYGDDIFNADMERYKGKETKIVRITYDGEYKLEIDDSKWFWTDEMLELTEETSKKTNPKAIEKTIRHIIAGNKTIILLKDENGKTLKGISRCHEEDEFDEDIGFMIAFSRTKGIEPCDEDEEYRTPLSEFI